jgi:hypothetical protein
LENERNKEKETFHVHQQIIKLWFDKHASGSKEFQICGLVLKWNKDNEAKGKHLKFQKLWLGPYLIAENMGDSTYHLQSL